MALQEDGKILYSEFSSGSTPPRLVTRLHSNGTLDTGFNPSVQSSGVPPPGVAVLLTQSDGKIVVGGEFQLVNGQSRPNLVRLTSSGNVDTTFDLGSGPDGPVQDMVTLGDGSLLVGGYFNTIGSTPRRMIARISPAGEIDPAFFIPPHPSDVPATSISRLTILLDGRVVIFGNFQQISGIPRPSFALLWGSEFTLTTAGPVHA